MSSFDVALKFVLADEGGDSDDPADHGGRTSRGITQREYSAWREEQQMVPKDVWAAEDSEIANIYYEEYWQPLCPTLPIGIDYLVFDMSVNAGPLRAAKLLQRALGVAEDGRIGPLTRKAIRETAPAMLVRNFSEAKRGFYRSLHQPRFLRGWLGRVDRVEARALAMLGGVK